MTFYEQVGTYEFATDLDRVQKKQKTQQKRDVITLADRRKSMYGYSICRECEW